MSDEERLHDVEHETVVDEEAQRKAKRNKRLRLLALALMFFVPLIIAKVTGFTDDVTVESVRELMQASGALGFLAFVAVFTIGELMHVPGLVFVGAASLAYGQGLGILAAFCGALTSVAVSFWLIRKIGGQPLTGFQRPLVKRVFAQLEKRPITTVAILRVVFILSPALNYALAMSKVRFRDFFLGSVLGLLLPIPIFVLAFDYVAEWLLY